MPPSKKKKKPVAAAAARGFATTSVASQAKREQLLDTPPTSTTTTTPDHTNGTSTPSRADGHSAQKDVVTKDEDFRNLTPEELEERLESSELQQVVDAHASKVRKDAARQITRLETDKRLLRGQAEALSTRAWLDSEASESLLSMLQDERAASDSVKFPGDVLIKLWTLQLALKGLELSEEHLQKALDYVLDLSAVDETASMIWGLKETLEWLSRQPETIEGDDYDSHKPIVAQVSHNETSDAEKRILEVQKALKPKVKPGRAAPASTTRQQDQPEMSDVDISDTDSELDPDEMLAKHTSYRLRLFEHDSNRFDSEVKDVGLFSRNEKRLWDRIETIQKDPLFDKTSAELEWREKRAQAYQQRAARRRLGLGSNVATSDSDMITRQAETITADLLESEQGDDALLGDMFHISDERPPIEIPGLEDGTIQTRDLGKISGMSPRRILEETCKARDSGSKVFTHMISENVYHCRHLVLVEWSKDQPIMDASYMQQIRCHATQRQSMLEMSNVATHGQEQSEGFVCTAALFALFSSSPKDDKTALRLPAAFRDLYAEFAAAKDEVVNAEDRENVRYLRRVIENHQKSDEEDDVILKSAFKNRSLGSSGNTTPLVVPDQVRLAFDEGLVDLWSRKSSTSAYKTMLKTRQELPMFKFRDQALDMVRNHQVTILCGETGCGKSTQMPSFILEDQLRHGKECRIYCTEPRRISAVSLAQRVSEELGEGKGAVGTGRSVVGYAIRLESQTTQSTRLVYATVGIVLRMLESSTGLDDLTHLIIDEVHERSIDTDFLLIILRSLLHQRPELKVILMSATVDAEKFSRYLNNAPVITVPGRTFPVRALYLEDAIEMTGYATDASSGAVVEDDDSDSERGKPSLDLGSLTGYSKSTIKTLGAFDEYRIDYHLIIRVLELVALSSDMHSFSKAVLVFLPGIGEIRQLADMLAGHRTFSRDWLLFPLHSTFSNEEQQAAFQIPPSGMRKIVLATNIAETGITIPDVTCVIDTGKHKEMRFDERRQLSRLTQSFISRANAKQRRGRAGRVQEGICFHLFTRQRHDTMMIEQQVPEMLRLSLQDLVMRVKICKLGDIESALLQAMDPPSSKNIRRAIDALVEVGALSADEELTSLGQQIAKLPLDAQLAKLMLLGTQFGCLDFVLTAAAMASSKSPFLVPMNAKRQADTVRLGFKRGDSDMLTSYNAYLSWRRVCTTPGSSELDFCKRNFLSPQNLASVEELKGQLLLSLTDTGLLHLSHNDRNNLSRARHRREFVQVPAAVNINSDNDVLVSSVIAWAFYPKILTRKGKGWRSIANNQSLSLQPTSVNKLSTTPSFEHACYLSFYSIMQGGRFTNAQETTPVEPIALVLLAGDAKFDMYAGVISVDGNRLRFMVKTRREMACIKALRTRVRDILAKAWKRPGRELSTREREWWDVFVGVFVAIDQRRSKDRMV